MSHFNNHSYSILVVDDVLINRTYLSKVLKEKGYNIYLATNGVEAIKIIKNKNIHLILLDYHMPFMDGFKVLSYTKNNSKEYNIPIIFLSSCFYSCIIKRCLAVGAFDFLIKPVRVSHLYSRIHDALELYYPAVSTPDPSHICVKNFVS